MYLSHRVALDRRGVCGHLSADAARLAALSAQENAEEEASNAKRGKGGTKAHGKSLAATHGEAQKASAYEDPRAVNDELLRKVVRVTATFQRTVRIANCRRVTQAGLEELAQMTLLRELDISGTSLSSLEMVRGMGNLCELSLAMTSASDVECLGGLTRLRTLNLRYCPVRDIGPLRACAGLQDVDLGGCPLRDVSPLGAAVKRRLRALALDTSGVRSLEPLRGGTSLVMLNVGMTQVSENVARAIIADTAKARLAEEKRAAAAAAVERRALAEMGVGVEDEGEGEDEDDGEGDDGEGGDASATSAPAPAPAPAPKPEQLFGQIDQKIGTEPVGLQRTPSFGVSGGKVFGSGEDASIASRASGGAARKVAQKGVKRRPQSHVGPARAERFFEAAMYGDVNMLRACLDAGQKVDERVSPLWAPRSLDHWQRGCARKTRWFQAAAEDPESRPTALHLAVFFVKEAAVTLLVENGAIPMLTAWFGSLPQEAFQAAGKDEERATAYDIARICRVEGAARIYERMYENKIADWQGECLIKQERIVALLRQQRPPPWPEPPKAALEVFE